MREPLRSVVSIVVILAVGGAIAWAGSHGSVSWAGWPLFAWCGAFSFALNIAVFVPSYVAQTEHYFDLTGSLTYLTLLGTSLAFGPRDPRAWLIAALVAVWAVRLGRFLFRRVREDGSDGRFDALKPSFARFLMTWTLQGLWVFLTLACGLAAMTSAQGHPLGVFAFGGAALWALGFAVETVADGQKRRFRETAGNEGRFITTGLWAWSRHPNYAGEIVLWLGIAVIAWPVLQGWQLATLVSPLFVYVLLTRISGVPLLESRGKRRWGDEPAYQDYKRRTPVLWPRPPRSA